MQNTNLIHKVLRLFTYYVFVSEPQIGYNDVTGYKGGWIWIIVC